MGVVTEGAVAAVRRERERSRSVIASSLFGGSGAAAHVFPLWAFRSHFRYFKIWAPVFVYPAEENVSHAQRWSWSGLEAAQTALPRCGALGCEKR